MKLFLLFMGLTINLFSQKIIDISYGERVKLKSKNENTIYSFYDKGNKLYLTNTEFSQYIFQTPGEYTIDLSQMNEGHSRTCEHNSTSKNIIVRVDSIKVSFIEKSLNLSNKLVQNQLTDGILLSIDVVVENFYKSKIKFPIQEVESAGIGTDIKAIPLLQYFIGLPGRYILTYSLIGKCIYTSHIQFDFKNHRNEIIPIALKEPLSSN